MTPPGKVLGPPPPTILGQEGEGEKEGIKVRVLVLITGFETEE